MRWRYFLVAVLFLKLVLILIPVVHLSGAFPNLLTSTSLVEGKIRFYIPFIKSATGVDFGVYWKFICEISSQCRWTSDDSTVEYILFPNGIVETQDGMVLLD